MSKIAKFRDKEYQCYPTYHLPSNQKQKPYPYSLSKNSTNRQLETYLWMCNISLYIAISNTLIWNERIRTLISGLKAFSARNLHHTHSKLELNTIHIWLVITAGAVLTSSGSNGRTGLRLTSKFFNKEQQVGITRLQRERINPVHHWIIASVQNATSLHTSNVVTRVNRCT